MTNLTRAEFVDASQHNSPLGHCYQDALDPFTRIQWRIDSTNRMYLRTLKALQDLQAPAAFSQFAASRPAEQAPDTMFSEPASLVATQPLAPPVGFVPPNAPASAERLRAGRLQDKFDDAAQSEPATFASRSPDIRGVQ
ncbi:MAG: hypothetical protein DMG57_27340 [Acidobacteria bacterium]|nr:MAG: hypothetical protein DMG57_27340 [Acidobacteriota bacterium]